MSKVNEPLMYERWQQSIRNADGNPIIDFWTIGLSVEEVDRLGNIFAAAPGLLEACKELLADLNARIDAAPDNAKPVFRGIDKLFAAIAAAEGGKA